MDILSKLALKYGTDKCPELKHPYTPFYFELLKDRRFNIRKVLEFGIGSAGNFEKKAKHDKNLNRDYYTGAGLYMWRDFFPKAQIYGADYRDDCMFEDERIKTFKCDENNKEQVENVIKQTGTDIDLFIDDASHRMTPQLTLAQIVLPLLDKKVIYIIEDIFYPRRFPKIFQKLGYNCYVPDLPKKVREDCLVVITKK